MTRNEPLTCVGVAGFEPAASSSRSQVTESVGSASAFLTCNASSISVPWRPSLATAVVTHLVTQALSSSRDRRTCHCPVMILEIYC
jgi:hypothetical protein